MTKPQLPNMQQTVANTILIINTRPKPANGRLGLAGLSLCATSAQLGRGKCSFFVTHTQTLHHNIYMREGTFIASFGFYKLDKSFYTVKFRWQEVGVQAAATDESSIASHEMKRKFWRIWLTSSLSSDPLCLARAAPRQTPRQTSRLQTHNC